MRPPAILNSLSDVKIFSPRRIAFIDPDFTFSDIAKLCDSFFFNIETYDSNTKNEVLH